MINIYDDRLLRQGFSRYFNGTEDENATISINRDVCADQKALGEALQELGYYFGEPDDGFDDIPALDLFEIKMNDYLESGYYKDDGRYGNYVLSVFKYYFG